MKLQLLVGLVAVFLSGAAVASPPIDVTCLRAAGYYGGVRIREINSQVRITVKNGLILNPNAFLLHLGVPQPGFVSNVQLVVPTSSCKAQGPVTMTCQTNQVKAYFRVENGPIETVILHEALIKLEPTKTGQQIRATIAAMRRNDKGVELVAEMTDVFGTPDKPAHASCRANF